MPLKDGRYGNVLQSLRWPYKQPNARNYAQHDYHTTVTSVETLQVVLNITAVVGIITGIAVV